MVKGEISSEAWHLNDDFVFHRTQKITSSQNGLRICQHQHVNCKHLEFLLKIKTSRLGRLFFTILLEKPANKILQLIIVIEASKRSKHY